jgi:antitoxin VapB
MSVLVRSCNSRTTDWFKRVLDKRAEVAEKTERVLRMLAELKLGGLLLSAQHNFSWLTAGGINGVDTSREAGVCGLLVRSDGRRFLLANRIEMPRLLAEEVREEDFEPVEYAWEDEKATPTFLVEHALSLLNGERGVGSDLPVGAQARVVESSIARCRYRLTETEIERYRALGRDAGAAICEVVENLEPGQAEQEVARQASDALAARGARGVVVLVAADERLEKFRHPVPTNRRWEKVLMIVVCARRGGLIASLSRIVCAGAVPQELKRRTRAAALVNARLLQATRPGVTGAQLYEVAARAYAEEGFRGEERLHHQGGATGYRTREWVAHPACEEVVEVNQAFAWNPSITGTKVEETCIVSGSGVETITASPGWPMIRVEEQGQCYALPDVWPLS